MPCRKTRRTYHLRDLCSRGKEEPHDTLMSKKPWHWTENIIADGNSHYPTCFQSRSPIPNVPTPSLRKRNSPVSMVRSNTVSVIKPMVMLSLLLSELNMMQPSTTGLQSERSCRSTSLEDPTAPKDVYSPVRYLIERPICKTFSIIYRKSDGRTCLE